MTLSTADDSNTVKRLLDALDELTAAAPGFPPPAKVDLPSFDDIEIEPVLLPRDAFFGPREDVPVEQAVGRVAAKVPEPVLMVLNTNVDGWRRASGRSWSRPWCRGRCSRSALRASIRASEPGRKSRVPRLA